MAGTPKNSGSCSGMNSWRVFDTLPGGVADLKLRGSACLSEVAQR